MFGQFQSLKRQASDEPETKKKKGRDYWSIQ